MSDSQENQTNQSDSEQEYTLEDDKPKKKGQKVNKSAKKKPAKSKKGEKGSKKEVAKKTGKKTVKKDKKTDKKPKKERPKKEKKTNSVRKPRAKKEPAPKPEPVSSFSKLGQRYMTPPPGDGTRGFYESLYEENPNSLIAIRFCVEYGIFGGKKHSEVLSKYTLLQKHGHFKGTTGALRPNAISFLEKLKTKTQPD